MAKKHLASLVIDKLIKRSMTLATAESCTGGMIGEVLTSIPGASAAYYGGVISYDNSVKSGVLGVKAETLFKFGAVSEETASEMAIGTKKICGCDIAVSVSGIAGPSGGTPQKPVGTVCFGIASVRGVFTETMHFGESRSRDEIRCDTVMHALELVLKEIDNI